MRTFSPFALPEILLYADVTYLHTVIIVLPPFFTVAGVCVE